MPFRLSLSGSFAFAFGGRRLSNVESFDDVAVAGSLNAANNIGVVQVSNSSANGFAVNPEKFTDRGIRNTPV
jgi:hypothetical protein